MVIEITQDQFFDSKINLNNVEIQFKNGKAKVNDKLGKELIEQHDWVFEEGKVVKAPEKPKNLQIDEAVNEKLVGEIAQLKNSLKQKDQTIEALRAENKIWREKFKEVSDQAKSKEEQKETIAIPLEDLVKENNVEEKLMNLTIQEVKQIAIKLQVPDEKVANKTKKEDWVKAVLDYTHNE